MFQLITAVHQIARRFIDYPSTSLYDAATANQSPEPWSQPLVNVLTG